MLLNLRDGFRVLAGCWQAYWLLAKLKPEIIFIKGGFVGVPVGLAAALRRIPYVTHDSDAVPGLANRLIARWARTHAVALPREMYHYPPHKTVTVGVPVGAAYRPVDAELQAAYRSEAGLDAYEQVLVVTGGGLGAQRLNTALIAIVPQLLTDFPGLAIVHTAGRANETGVREGYAATVSAESLSRVKVLGYANDLYRYTGAADLVVMRAGATAIAECAVQGKAVILAPNPYLTAGHQLKNAQALADQGAVEVVSEKTLTDEPEVLRAQISSLLRSAERRTELGSHLQQLSHPDSARELAMVLLKEAAR
jgi:UDP-N-acetylglucosamine--N-acetylmuramyl-(pentapeptide) pyrophosphoryl-undecaprenol N-acetylglucosamine transferase